MAEPTKADLISQAQQMGIEVDDSMTKAEIQELIDSASGGGTPATPEEEDSGPLVCARCGEPATYKTVNAAVNEVGYCDQHAQASGEPVASLTGNPE